MAHSVLRQTVQDFEVIAVDDSSDDGSIEEIRRLYGNRVRIFETRGEYPLGPGAARNIGVKNARGDWIAFLDADDEWHPEFLSEMHALINLFPGVSAFSCGYYITGDGGPERIDPHTVRYGHLGRHKIGFKEYLRRVSKLLPPVWTSATVMRRSIVLEVGGFPEDCESSEDTDTWLRVAAISPVGWSPFVGAWYHRAVINRTAGKHLPARCVPLVTLGLMYGDNRYYDVRREIRRYMNRIVISRMTQKARIGKVLLKDLSGYSFIHGPLLFLQCLLLLLPRKVVLPLLAVRKALMSQMRNWPVMIKQRQS